MAPLAPSQALECELRHFKPGELRASRRPGSRGALPVATACPRPVAVNKSLHAGLHHVMARTDNIKWCHDSAVETDSLARSEVPVGSRSAACRGRRAPQKPFSITALMAVTNDVFHRQYPLIKPITDRRVALQKEAHRLKDRLAEIHKELKIVQAEEKNFERTVGTFKTPAFFSRQLPDDVKLSIVGRVGHWGSQKVACVCRDFKASVA